MIRGLFPVPCFDILNCSSFLCSGIGFLMTIAGDDWMDGARDHGDQGEATI